MEIVVVGLGHVGMPLAAVFSQYFHVVAVDIDEEKMKKIKFIRQMQGLQLNMKNLDIRRASKEVYQNADMIFIAVPTDLNDDGCRLDTRIIEEVLLEITKAQTKATVVIKSTVPVGFTEHIKNFLKIPYLFFSPEFLREEHEIEDILYPSRIVIGYRTKNMQDNDEMQKRVNECAMVFLKCAKKKDVPVVFTGMSEAESIKLFANTFLALKISFFNELDNFCIEKELCSRDIIEGVCLDKRIGMGYNNPSFGFGGYCLPKDTQQLNSDFAKIPQCIIKNVNESNMLRKKYICTKINEKKPKIIGIYRLLPKKNATSIRNSPMDDIVCFLEQLYDVSQIIVYEPILKSNVEKAYQIVNDLTEFKKNAELIVANRMYEELIDVKEKVYTRDVFSVD